jgi:predicted regulator of Ras-like GTPase activity (Roadblock/LC7/MglB family)
MNDELADVLTAYRRDEGIHAALLVGHDGFPVASAAEAGIDPTAIAAQVADILGVCHRLALELGQQETRFITFELTGLNVVVAPFDGDLLLVLVGEPEAIRLSYSLRDGA